LCLGRSEWLAPAVLPAFDIVDRKARLFRRKASVPSGGRP
jgi:hypothetical protein